MAKRSTDRAHRLAQRLRRILVPAAALASLCADAAVGQTRLSPASAVRRPAQGVAYSDTVVAAAGGSAVGGPVARTSFQPLIAEQSFVDLNQIARDLQTAKSLEESGNPHCVDLYFWSALRAWRALGADAPLGPAVDSRAAPPSRALQLYNTALDRLIASGQRFKRLDPGSHLAIDAAGSRVLIPILRHGLVWEPEDFCQLLCGAEFHSRRINNEFVTRGVGASLVAVRDLPSDERSILRRLPFAVSAVLRPTLPEDGLAVPAVIDFYNPHLTESLAIAGRSMPLARNLTAPLALVQNTAPAQYFYGFVRPDDMKVQPELVMLEPYQPGKIPVIFIHGLFSDPLAWSNAANELMAVKDLYCRCQFWAFSYPTGGDLLRSAAQLREDLLAVREQFDPRHEDPALENMVIVAHSLGGLMTKLQIASSRDLIWDKMAHAPLEAVRASNVEKAEIADMVYFEPVPWITRAVFMGTPFQGSSWALRTVGRVSSDLVRFSSQEDTEYKQLIRDNRDIFDRYLWRSRPTTVDMLEPDSPILLALSQMPVNPRTRLHTIIGDGAWRAVREPSDGIVAVRSARHPSVQSELIIPALHTELHSHPMAIAELERILRDHLAEAGSADPAVAGGRPGASAAPMSKGAGRANVAAGRRFADVFGD